MYKPTQIYQLVRRKPKEQLIAKPKANLETIVQSNLQMIYKIKLKQKHNKQENQIKESKYKDEEYTAVGLM